jgi:clan AA aspartic protease (TIGR02281 family)
VPADPILQTMRRLDMTMPRSAADVAAIRGPLLELSREACDRTAIINLGFALKKSSYKRDGAKALIAFSDQCNGDVPALRTAANIYLDISDYKQAMVVATEIIKADPLVDNGYFLRAMAAERDGQFKRAIDDYASAIELFKDKSRIGSASYSGQARAHEKLGQFCDAALSIEAFVAANPQVNDTAQAKTLIADYSAKGKCTVSDMMDDTFPIQRRGDVILVDVTINGVKGRFIVDTGATWVSMSRSFAEKSKVTIDEDSVVKLSTANGMTDGTRGRAAAMQLKTVKAADVPVIVQKNQKGNYGDGIDGLLGMSFLSRFNVTLTRDKVRVQSRAGR